MRFALDHKYILIAIATSFIGASARISYEKEDKIIKNSKKISYYTASIFVAYIIYESLQYFEKERATGILCALGGLISIDIIKLLIEELPSLIRRRLKKEITGETNKNENDEI